jgi:acyl-CoA reductase-like NAD-dependent aldehyde dehydrogenase
VDHARIYQANLAQIFAEGAKPFLGQSGAPSVKQAPTAALLRPEPSLVTDLPNCSAFQFEPIGGPVLPITTVKYAHEAVKWANNSSHVFAATVWGDDVEKCVRMAERLDAATIAINPQNESGFRSIRFSVKNSQLGIQGPGTGIELACDKKSILSPNF